MRLWDTATNEEVAVFKEHASDVRCLAFAPDGKTLVAGANDGSIKIWAASGEDEAVKAAETGFPADEPARVLVEPPKAEAAPHPAGPPSQAERVVLDNGITLLMSPLPQASQVAVETLYDVGFLHEPKGMTQAAHLLEHLVCNAATKSCQQNEAMNRLNQLGMANAETLPDWTHYDYVPPSDRLELALEVEAERLTGLEIEENIIRAEAARCYQETDSVERTPASGMLKHAFMAFNQAWRHGTTSALVRGGLEDLSVEDLTSFHHAFYRPDNLTLVVVGGFDRDHALPLIKKHLGSIRTREKHQRAAINWSKIPKRAAVQWDAKVRAVCVAFPPPPNRSDCVTLSLLGTALAQNLMTDAEINSVASSVMCTNYQWSLGELPFFAYATAKPNVPLEDVERVLTERLRRIVGEKPSDIMVMQMRMMANELSRQMSTFTWESLQNVAKMAAKQTGAGEERALGMALAQSALNWGVAERLMGPDPAVLAAELSSLSAESLRALMATHLDPNKQFVTLLTPAADSTCNDPPQNIEYRTRNDE